MAMACFTQRLKFAPVVGAGHSHWLSAIVKSCSKDFAPHTHHRRAFLDGNRIVVRHAHRNLLELRLVREIIVFQRVENRLQVLEFLAHFVLVRR